MRLRTALAAAFALALPATAEAADAGEIAFNYCYSCHSVDPKEKDLPAPNLFGVLCRKPGSLKDFEYSPGMVVFAKKTKVWTPTLIDQYLADPQAMVPDSPMELPPQLKSAEVRRDIVGYLARHSGDAGKACPK